jgi:RNA recognition motif-containing protein
LFRYAFVEYETHRAAALARRKLVPGRIFLFDQELERVDWAEPEPEVDDEIAVKGLFIRNLNMITSEEMITDIFNAFSQGQVDRVKKTKDYAFVHFTTRDAAEMAFESTKSDLYIDKRLIEVNWYKQNARKQFPKPLISAGPS